MKNILETCIYPVIINLEKESVCYLVKINEDGTSNIVGDSTYPIKTENIDEQIDSLISNVG